MTRYRLDVTYVHGRRDGDRYDAHLVLANLRPGQGPDGTCAFDVIASCTSFEAAVAAAALVNGVALAGRFASVEQMASELGERDPVIAARILERDLEVGA